jgi:hypothetical protein
MTERADDACSYRVLGGVAVIHSGAVLALMAVPMMMPHISALRVGLTTLWFLWPIVFALHRGRSARRFIVSMLCSTVLIAPSLREYSLIAGEALGLPEGNVLTPWRIYSYTAAYTSGRAEAKSDVKAGKPAVEVFGLGAAGGHRVVLLRERYGIEIRPTAGCLVNDRILGHAAGYNAISKPEIARRFGPGVIERISEEGWQLDAQQRAREAQYAKDLASRLTNLPSTGNVRLRCVRLFVNQAAADHNLVPDEMAAVAEMVHAIESLVASEVPGDAPKFESDISGELTPSGRPKFEIFSSSIGRQNPIHMRIYGKLYTLPDIRSPRARIYLWLTFDIAAEGTGAAVTQSGAS